MSAEAIRVSPSWLALRERADAASRSRELVSLIRRRLPSTRAWVIHDLACGSGAMSRWLAPRLPGRQRWILHDRDEELLAVAAADVPSPSVAVETRVSDITQIGPDGLTGATLVTASAILDLLTRDELAALVESCVGAGCPVLFTLSVTGHVRLDPADLLDARVAAAFDAHQRRTAGRGRLLGPDAAAATVEAFREVGAEVVVAPSPWRLGPAENELAAEWLTGWIDAACEQEPVLAAEVELYRRRRLRQANGGQLDVTVDHADLLVLP